MWMNSPLEAWQTYSYDRVHFGDDIAAVCVVLEKKIMVEAGMEIDPEACLLLL